MLQALDEGEGLLQLWKLPLFGLELRRVHATTETSHFDRVLEVQHFVVQEVFDGIARARGPIEDAAYHDRVVRGVIVPQQPLGVTRAPSELGSAQQSAKESIVETVEDLFKVVVAPFRPRESLGAASVTDKFGLPCHGGTGSEALETQIVNGVDRLAVELCQQDVGNGSDDPLWCAFKKVRKTDVNPAFAETDSRV